MYGKGSTRVLEGVVELRMRPLSYLGCKRNGRRFFRVDAGGLCLQKIMDGFEITKVLILKWGFSLNVFVSLIDPQRVQQF